MKSKTPRHIDSPCTLRSIETSCDSLHLLRLQTFRLASAVLDYQKFEFYLILKTIVDCVLTKPFFDYLHCVSFFFAHELSK